MKLYFEQHVHRSGLSIGAGRRLEAINVSYSRDCFFVKAIAKALGDMDVVRAAVSSDHNVKDHHALNF